MSAWVQIGLVLAAALACGLASGATGGAPKSAGGRGGAVWLLFTLLVLAAGLGLPALGLVVGRPALWLEGAALLWAVYVAGCAIGCTVRRGESTSR